MDVSVVRDLKNNNGGVFVFSCFGIGVLCVIIMFSNVHWCFAALIGFK